MLPYYESAEGLHAGSALCRQHLPGQRMHAACKVARMFYNKGSLTPYLSQANVRLHKQPKSTPVGPQDSA
jgi:hypothetical protein